MSPPPGDWPERPSRRMALANSSRLPPPCFYSSTKSIGERLTFPRSVGQSVFPAAIEKEQERVNLISKQFRIGDSN